MRNLKKVLSVALSLALAFTMMVMPVSAAAAEPTPEIIVTYTQEPLVFHPALARCLTVPKTVYDLREAPLVYMTLDELLPYKTLYSPHAYKTNTTQIILKTQADTFGLVRISLINKSTKKILAQKTINMDIWNTIIQFTNLTSVVDYAFQFDNVGQTSLYIKGQVSPK